MSRNLAASVRARLKNRADASEEDFNLILTRYGLERLLYRLSVSRHANNFVLKGALLFLLWYDLPQRPTRDADLLGFGDVVIPAPETVRYPVLLEDSPVPQLRVYPRCAVIAEKLQALCVLGRANSRMKDFFDLWVLTGDRGIESSQVAAAIAATFARRKTALPADWPIGLQEEFAADATKRAQWQAFLRKSALEAPSLAIVVAELRMRLAEPLGMAKG